EVRQLAQGLEKQAFDESRVHQLAFMKLLQDIGEAASRLSPVARNAISEVPWPKVIGLRHHLVHDYGGIDLQRIWSTVREDIEPLLAAIEPVLPPEGL